MIKISEHELNKQIEQVKMAAFSDELEKMGAAGLLAKVTKMFGRKAMKKAVKWAKSNTARSNRFTKKPGKKRASGKGLNWAQKGVGKILFRSKQLVKNPRQFFKDDMFKAKYKSVNPNKVKKGKYTTIFGNKRKVVGYGGKTPYIKKRLPARALGTAFTVPGFAAMNIGLGQKRDKKGRKIGVAERGLKGTAEGLAWNIAPTATMAAYGIKIMKDMKSGRT